jgi:hypothetical protein
MNGDVGRMLLEIVAMCEGRVAICGGNWGLRVTSRIWERTRARKRGDVWCSRGSLRPGSPILAFRGPRATAGPARTTSVTPPSQAPPHVQLQL